MRHVLVSFVVLLASFLALFLAGDAITSSSEQGTTFYKRSSSAIALTKDGQTLLAVNPDSNSISIIDLGDLTTVHEIPTGSDPRTVAVDDAGERVYVANRGSDSISVIDLGARQHLQEIPVGSRPYGVVVSPDGRFLYAAEQGSNRLRILDAAKLTTINLVATGERPSGLAISGDGHKLYITHLLSNKITVLNARLPYYGYLPVVQSHNDYTNQETAVTQPDSSAQASFATIDLWPDSNLVQSVIIAPDEELAYIPHTRSNSSNRALTFDTTVFPLVSLIDLTTEEHLLGQQLDLGTLDPPGVGLPFDGMASPDGSELWIANAASNDITVINLETRQLAAHIEVGDNPRGLVLSPDGETAYVNNTLAGTVSIIDTKTYSVTNTITTTAIPLPPLLLAGKRLFHSSDDPRLSKNQWIACNSCHFDGEHDGRTWFFGFAGPRNTTSLLGMIQTYPLRWSGEWDESADSEFAIRKENFGAGLIDGAMHCDLSPPDCVYMPPNQGRAAALDALAAFMDAQPMPLSPAHAHGEPLDATAERGRSLFMDPALGCITCHPPPYYTDQQTHDVGTATGDEKISPAFDTPSLRGLHNSAPYFHDGSAAALIDTLTYPSPNSEHDLRDQRSESEIQDLAAFLRALPYAE